MESQGAHTPGIMVLTTGLSKVFRRLDKFPCKYPAADSEAEAVSAVTPLALANQYDALIGDGRAGVEAPSCKKGVHVRTCRCTPHLTCVSLLSNGSLAAHQVQTQSAQQFARYGKRVCTCARADATHPDLCEARIYWAPSHTQNLSAILPAVCEIWKRGVHVRTCRCTPPQTCRKHLSNGPLVTHKI